MELSYEQFNSIFMIGIICAIFFFVLSIVLLFALKIPAVISELTGLTAKKAIAEIKKGNNNSFNNTQKHQKKNKNNKSVAVNYKPQNPNTAVTTASLGNRNLKKDYHSSETSVLETSVLNTSNDFVTTVSANAEYSEQTSVLTDEVDYSATETTQSFFVRQEIVMFVSDEVIV